MKIERKLNKIYASVIAILFLVIALGSAYAVTINFAGNKATVSDGTYFYSGNYDWISGSHFNLSKKIYTSTGLVYNATGANIKTAYYSLNSTGGAVWLPPGTFYMPGQLRLASDKALIGSGMGITKIVAASGNTASIFVGIAASESSMDNITVSDLTIDGNTTAGNCISIEGVTDFLFKNIEILDPDTNGMAVWFSRNGIIDNCRCYNVTDASYEPFAFNNMNQSIVSNLLVYRSYNWAYDFHTCHNCTITNLVAYHSKYGAKWFGDVGESGGYNVVSNLAFYNTSFTVGASLWIKREHNSSFSNIVIQGRDTGLVIDGSDYITINNFNINTTDYGFYVSSSIASCKHLHISNGIIKSYSSYGLTVDTAHNFTISNVEITKAGSANTIAASKDFMVSSCSFMNGGSYGLYLNGCSFFKVTDSIFMLDTTAGLATLGPCQNYSINGCTFEKNNAIGLYVTAADRNFTVINNLFSGHTGRAISMHISANNFYASYNIAPGATGSANYYDWNAPATATRCCNATYGGFNMGSDIWA